MSDEAKEIAAKALEDPVFFCRYFLPNLFPTEMPWFHRAILAILTRRTKFLTKYGDLEKIKRNFVFERDGKFYPIFLQRGKHLVLIKTRFTLIMMPRGFSKTTLAGVAVPLYDTVFAINPVTVYVSETAGHANMQLSNVKRELETNEKIKAIFGNLKPSMSDPQKWTEGFFETTTGIALAARGRGGQIRGFNHGGNRPKKIICDDLEDKESVKTEEQRKKVRTWAYGDLMPALPEMDPDATIVALGTLLHEDALLKTWMRDPEWTCVVLGAIDNDGDLLWPQNLDHKKLETKKKSFQLAGELSTFYMEYHSKIKNTDDSPFQSRYFKHSDEPREFQNAIFCDPAISESRKADRATIAVVGMSERGRLRVQQTWGKRGATPREIIDMYFEMAMMWHCRKHGFESNGFQKALKYLIQEEMFRKKHYFEVLPIFSVKDNEARIRGILQPRYAAGYIEHRIREPELEAELLDFPNGKHDDYPTAVAGAVALLQPYAAQAGMEGEEDDLAKDEYEPQEASGLGGVP